jgi:hypothetical protein
VLDQVTAAQVLALVAEGHLVPVHHPQRRGGDHGGLPIFGHVIPVLLGRGRRLFDVLPWEIELEIVRVTDTPAATYIRYRVCR